MKNGSIVNYSPHTAWIREDGKEPRVIKHDGLAFVPDPRVYGKCRPAALKDFVAYKHLSRAKPRVSVTKAKSADVVGPVKTAQTSSKKQSSNFNPTGTKRKTVAVPGKDKKKTSPNKPPPKILEQIISQTLNRRTLGHNELFNTAVLQSKEKYQTKTKQKPTNSRSPTKKIN